MKEEKMKEIKLKDIPIKTKDGVPLVIGMKVYTVDIKETYREPWSLQINEYVIEYIDTTSRTFMSRELSKGLEYRFTGKCHYFSTIEAGRKALRVDVKDNIKSISEKIKYHSKNLDFLKGL